MEASSSTLHNPDGGEITEVRLSESIFLYENALSCQLCDEITDFFYSNIDIAAPGQTMGGHNSSVKNTLDISSTSSIPDGPLRDKYLDFDRRIYESLRVVSRRYMQTFDWLQKAPNLMDTGYLWQMYKANDGFYHEHVDGEVWNRSVSNRVVAFIVYLNTVDEGGETYFRHQDVSVHPVKGSVAMFPTDWSHPHQAMVPRSCDKLIISSFMVSE